MTNEITKLSQKYKNENIKIWFYYVSKYLLENDCKLLEILVEKLYDKLKLKSVENILYVLNL